jgi:tRNA threonylcarbamoyladenosine biosynthesis protein TsaE
MSKSFSKNVEETEKIAKIFLEKILQKENKKNGAIVVCLSGDLGAGKTAFTQAIGKHLGIKNKITSPTFVIMKKYPVPEQARYGAGPLPLIRGIKGVESSFNFLIHIDAYRLKNEKELLSLGWEEIINNKEHLVFIEWPENVKKIIPVGARFVYISHKENGERILELK